MTTKQTTAALKSGAFNESIASIYGGSFAEKTERLTEAVGEFEKLYGERDVRLFTVPGRSEISGNHTDHNHGRVIAASVDLDIIAVAAKTEDDVVRVKSQGFDEDVVDLGKFTEPDAGKYFTSEALIAGLAQSGMKHGGFCAYTTSNVFKGSGLSSSAAFEVMIGTIFNALYNDFSVSAVEIAKKSQFAENKFFGKPCGLMDQTACAVGGFITIDFADPSAPVIEKLPFDLSAAGYALCITDTGGNHADLNEDYASVPAEMKAVARCFGKEVLREVTKAEIIAAIPALREKCGDRAVMRALHFENENERVKTQAAALKNGDLDDFFAGVRASGDSSFKYLQNVFTTKNVSEQGISLALCLSDNLLAGKRAAWRVHGGGFAGTMQAFVPRGDVLAYKAGMEAVFGAGKCWDLSVRTVGAAEITAR